MIILSDLDAVVFDWNAKYDELLDSAGKFADNIPRTKDQPIFNLFEGRSEMEQEIIHAVMDTPRFYADLPLIDGAKDALNAMSAAGHTVYLVSTPHTSNPTCASDKYDNVSNALGPEWCDRLILTKDKTAVIGDVLIDDKPEIYGALTPEWTQIVFSQNWNRHVKTQHRMDGWANWEAEVQRARFARIFEGPK